MKKITLLSTLSVALLASFAAHAADTTELKVTGVIKPGACTPSFSGGGVAEYGAIATSTLKKDALNLLDEKIVSFAVTCDSASKVTIQATDNRKSSVIPGLLARTFSGWNDKNAFGLGTASGAKIGVYRMRLTPAGVAVDGKASDLIYGATDSGAWAKAAVEVAFRNDSSERISVATPGTVVPSALKTLTGDVRVQAVLDTGANLPVTDQINFDGSSSFEITYL